MNSTPDTPRVILARPSSRVPHPSLGRLHQLDVDRELDVLAYDEAAGLERLIPGEAELLAVDLALRLEAHPLAAPRVLAATLELGIECHFVRLIADREITDEGELAVDV